MGREKSGFEKLDVYRIAEDLSDLVWKCARGWDNFARDTIGKQVVRATDSVAANIAEGYGRGSAADNRRCVRIALGSLNECKNWLRRAFARGLLDAGQIEQIRPLLEKLLPMLNGYLRSIGRDRGSSRPTTSDPRPTTEA